MSPSKAGLFFQAQGTKKLGLLIFDGHHKKPSFFELLPDNTYKRPRGNIVEWWQPTSLVDATSPEGPLYPGSSYLRELPSVDLSSLDLLLKNDFLPKLMDLFKICEDSKNIHGLHLIYGLVQSIILLSNIPVFDRLFSGKCLMGVVGALEYNPEEPKAQNHRCRLEKVVNEHVIYKEALPVKDQSGFTKLCRSYGVDYIKDVILPGTLDEVTIASLSLFVYANNVMLYSSLKDDSCFIRELLAKLKSDGISPDSQRDLVLLLCELWSFSESTKSTQISDFWWGIIDGKTYNITVTVMQTIIAQNDEHWIHRVVKNNLLRLVIEIFCEVGNRTNVFHDGVLQLLEYIAKGDMKVLVIYLWEMFSEKLKKFNMLPSIQALKIKYKRLEDSEQKTEFNIAKGPASNKAEERDLDKLAAEGDFKEEDMWTHVLSFYKKIIHEKEKVD
ncbi:hypothetical protein LUZ61_018536 [Rhynchospora tenuis]|uniref:Serine/threonine-protein phosphatase 4 regulatory subunit 3-like central domain-containing protein n=1 Tax=Rhynchospora tenuis TaxID=198213 RepID=A0AAD6EM25_9POAL|nr:hypothetical protein LUZ61_018536 [Rhynchospora tenuis]